VADGDAEQAAREAEEGGAPDEQERALRRDAAALQRSMCPFGAVVQRTKAGGERATIIGLLRSQLQMSSGGAQPAQDSAQGGHNRTRVFRLRHVAGGETTGSNIDEQDDIGTIAFGNDLLWPVLERYGCICWASRYDAAEAAMRAAGRWPAEGQLLRFRIDAKASKAEKVVHRRQLVSTLVLKKFK